MQNRTRNAWAVGIALAIASSSAQAQSTTITGTATAGDTWNDATNWSAGVPSGTYSAVVGTGVFAEANNPATSAYSGTLTLDANATLKLACSGGGCGSGTANALQGASSIIMNAGSEIQVNINQDLFFPPITLLGDAQLSSLFGASDHQTDNFGPITGPYTLTLNHFNNHAIHLNVSNTFTELIADCIDRWKLHGNAAGSFGTGNVTINPRADGRSASLYINASNAIASTATLTLNGSVGQGGYTGDGSQYVIMNADTTVAGLNLWGTAMPSGTYTNSEVWIQGAGTLTVSGGPGTNYCISSPNSTGAAAEISAEGSDSIATNALVLHSGPVPDQPGIFFYATNQAQIPFGNGYLCATGGIHRLPPTVSTGNHAMYVLDFPTLAFQINPGDTWNFQHWYRDPAAGGAFFNTSDGLEILFTL